MGTNLNSGSTNTSFVGYSSLADQVTSRLLQENYYLNILVIGCRNCGKKSFLNNLFKTKFPTLFTKHQINGLLESPYYLLKENGVKLNVKIIKHHPENESEFSGNILVDYLVKCFENQYENDYNPRLFKNDHVVHVCLYFIEPYSQERTLKYVDLNILQSIHNKVNVIPIIAKADCYTPKELLIYKTNLLNEFLEAKLNLFKFEPINYLDLKISLKIAGLISRFPFAVVGSDNTVLSRRKSLKPIRRYAWGTIEVDNLEHCDTAALRILMLQTHLNALIESAHSKYYTEYRIDKLSQLYAKINDLSVNHPLYYMENRFKFTVQYYLKTHQSNFDKCMIQLQIVDSNIKEKELKFLEENKQNQSEIENIKREYEERKRYKDQLENDILLTPLTSDQQQIDANNGNDWDYIEDDINELNECNPKLSDCTPAKSDHVSLKDRLLAFLKQGNNK